MTWWIVTLRRSGDDEDSCYIVKAANEEQAMLKADVEFRDNNDMTPRSELDEDQLDKAENTVYINYVVKTSGRQRPEIKMAPY